MTALLRLAAAALPAWSGRAALGWLLSGRGDQPRDAREEGK